MRFTEYKLILIICLLAADCDRGTARRTGGFPQREDSLKNIHLTSSMRSASSRFRADSQFIRSLVRTLRVPYSFYYPSIHCRRFPALCAGQQLSHLYWQFKKDDLMYLQEGAIQINEPTAH